MQRTPGSYNLYAVQGNSLDIAIRLKARAQDGTTGVVPVDGNLVFTAQVPGGQLVRAMNYDGALQAMQLSLSAADTRIFQIGRHRYEIEQKGGSQESTLLKGFLYISRGENTDG
jgi:hypothetical protein